jgi:hypothetical protein
LLGSDRLVGGGRLGPFGGVTTAAQDEGDERRSGDTRDANTFCPFRHAHSLGVRNMLEIIFSAGSVRRKR